MLALSLGGQAAFGFTTACLNVDGLIYNIPSNCQNYWCGDTSGSNDCNQSCVMTIPQWCLSLNPAWVAASGCTNPTGANGATWTGYVSSSVPYGQTCSSGTCTCNNGTWSGACFSACAPLPGAPCNFNGTSIPDGGSVTAYQTASGPPCTSEVRTCTNGALSGSYTYASCSVAAAGGPCTTAGQIEWQSSASKVEWCDGANWQDPGQTGSIGSCAGTTAGKINYAGGVLSYCDGSNWISMKGPQQGSCVGTTPGKYTYTGSFFQYCDGTNWYKMLGGGGGPPPVNCGGASSCLAYCQTQQHTTGACTILISTLCTCATGASVTCSPTCQ